MKSGIVAFLDISGAFNNVKWSVLIKDMDNQGASRDTSEIIKSYLEDRTVTYQVSSVSKSITLNKGCPHDSKVGSRLWNISAELALRRVAESEHVSIIDHADDFALLIVGNTRKDVITKIETELTKLDAWVTDRGLTFLKDKSMMLTLKGGLVLHFIPKFGTGKIKAVNTVRYLGVMIETDREYDT